MADIGIAALLNMYYVRRYTGFANDYAALAKSAAAAAVMGGAVFAVHTFLAAAARSNNLATLAAIGVGVGVYGLCLLALGAIGEYDIKMIPVVGGPLILVLRRLRLLRTEGDG